MLTTYTCIETNDLTTNISILPIYSPNEPISRIFLKI